MATIRRPQGPAIRSTPVTHTAPSGLDNVLGFAQSLGRLGSAFRRLADRRNDERYAEESARTARLFVTLDDEADNLRLKVGNDLVAYQQGKEAMEARIERHVEGLTDARSKKDVWDRWRVLTNRHEGSITEAQSASMAKAREEAAWQSVVASYPNAGEAGADYFSDDPKVSRSAAAAVVAVQGHASDPDGAILQHGGPDASARAHQQWMRQFEYSGSVQWLKNQAARGKNVSAAMEEFVRSGAPDPRDPGKRVAATWTVAERRQVATDFAASMKRAQVAREHAEEEMQDALDARSDAWRVAVTNLTGSGQEVPQSLVDDAPQDKDRIWWNTGMNGKAATRNANGQAEVRRAEQRERVRRRAMSQEADEAKMHEEWIEAEAKRIDDLAGDTEKANEAAEEKAFLELKGKTIEDAIDLGKYPGPDAYRHTDNPLFAEWLLDNQAKLPTMRSADQVRAKAAVSAQVKLDLAEIGVSNPDSAQRLSLHHHMVMLDDSLHVGDRVEVAKPIADALARANEFADLPAEQQRVTAAADAWAKSYPLDPRDPTDAVKLRFHGGVDTQYLSQVHAYFDRYHAHPGLDPAVVLRNARYMASLGQYAAIDARGDSEVVLRINERLAADPANVKMAEEQPMAFLSTFPTIRVQNLVPAPGGRGIDLSATIASMERELAEQGVGLAELHRVPTYVGTLDALEFLELQELVQLHRDPRRELAQATAEAELEAGEEISVGGVRGRLERRRR